MLLLDVNNGGRIWLQGWVSIDGREDCDLCVGAFLKEASECRSILRSPIDGEGGGAEALQLRHVVVGADDTFDGGCMSIRQGMAVVRRKEVMRDAAGIEAVSAEP